MKQHPNYANAKNKNKMDCKKKSLKDRDKKGLIRTRIQLLDSFSISDKSTFIGGIHRSSAEDFIERCHNIVLQEKLNTHSVVLASMKANVNKAQAL